MITVVVIDRDAGWVVETFGPYPSRAEADSEARRLRRQYLGLHALPSLTVARSAADSYEVRVVETQPDPSPRRAA